MDLGPFTLVAPLGRGAAGEVWRATRRRTGIEVAVKLLAAKDPARKVAFRNEVRARRASRRVARRSIDGSGARG
ncbi:MAG: hypothetical protein ACOZNI_04695 [Myxococcota bacterium]